MTETTRPIPTFYRVFFLYIDPLIAGYGAYLDFFDPKMAVDAFIPASISPYNPLQSFLQHQLGGALLMCVYLDFFLLRRTNEVWIWKAQQAGQLIWDLAMLWGMWYALRQQRRLDLNLLRPEDWGSFVITGTCTVVRIAFCLNVGLGKVAKRSKRS